MAIARIPKLPIQTIDRVTGPDVPPSADTRCEPGDAPPAERTRAKAALGVIAFSGPQGPGWLKGGHNDVTTNTLVCLERGRRCVLIPGNDVRIERAFPALLRAALAVTGVPYRWEYGFDPADA